MSINQRNEDESALVSSKYLPRGKVLSEKTNPSSKIYKLLKGLSGEFNRFESLLTTLKNEFDIKSTVELISEWEGAVGIPDSCFANTGPLKQRRLNVQAKIQADGIQSASSLEELIKNYGFNATVKSGSFYSVFPITFPWQFFGDEKTARFTIIINFENQKSTTVFPVNFPWPFTGDESAQLRCFIEQLVPSNTQVIFRFGDE